MHSKSYATRNAAKELERIREARSERRRRGRSYRSKFERYRAELVSLYHEGASFPELAFWLKSEKRLKAHSTSIMRYLYKLPELERRDG